MGHAAVLDVVGEEKYISCSDRDSNPRSSNWQLNPHTDYTNPDKMTDQFVAQLTPNELTDEKNSLKSL
jgi:hypothetical protein